MGIYLGSTALNTFRVGTQTPDRIFLGNDLVWPDITPVPQSFTAAGAWQWFFPVNCRFIDIIILGGGGGGQGSGSSFINGLGGNAGSWNAVTLKRGVDIPWDLAVISGVIGNGGGGGNWGFGAIPGLPGGAGGDTTATATGIGTLTAAGGNGVIGAGNMTGKSPGNFTWNGRLYVGAGNMTGKSPGNFTWNGRLYVGGAERPRGGSGTTNVPGNPPGGGGPGGQGGAFSGQNGGNGAPGAVFLYAY
ncbi:hypothetical protein REDROCK_8 [Mycobacterium phage RedRock]|uniref:Glycine-rich domain-containing protein n=1 Tax=Mycobacterium phage RedRock TaxID=711470 RepID=D3JZ71_9CAUD|nr:minor tail protein [Mycobacterium phage RedRock]ADB93702.1 hypothetical protein REDROCK_8 [Mycobacterium phage RedRock]